MRLLMKSSWTHLCANFLLTASIKLLQNDGSKKMDQGSKRRERKSTPREKNIKHKRGLVKLVPMKMRQFHQWLVRRQGVACPWKQQ